MKNSSKSNREDVVDTIVGAIKRCLEASGKAMRAVLPNEAPLAVIPDFDSLCGLEVTVELECKFQISLDDNVFIQTSGSRSRPRTLKEVCSVVAAALQSGGQSER